MRGKNKSSLRAIKKTHVQAKMSITNYELNDQLFFCLFLFNEIKKNEY